MSDSPGTRGSIYLGRKRQNVDLVDREGLPAEKAPTCRQNEMVVTCYNYAGSR